MIYFVEVRSTVRRLGPPKLVLLSDVLKYRGFRTIVGYDAKSAENICITGTTQGLQGKEVYADTLFMDFDNHDPIEFRQWLQQSELSYEEYHSGGRSVHFHIPIVPVFSDWITIAMKFWVKKHAPTADISFYHNAGLYRLPGTYHAKYPGQYKRLIAAKAGTELLLTRAGVVSLPHAVVTKGPEAFFAMLSQRKTEGQRQPFLWRLAVVGLEAGLTLSQVIEDALWWNERYCDPPHPPHIVQQQCESAYRRVK